MSKFHRFFWAFAPLVLLVQIFQSTTGLPPIVNVHESVESVEDVITLQLTMEELGIRQTVLSAIPEAFLYFEEDKVTLGEVEESNTLVQQISAQTAQEETFEFICAIDPLDVTRVAQLEKCLEDGGLGLKLYNGYSYSHILPLDDARLNELYSALQEKGAVLMLPVNAGEFQSELENVLTLYPDLNVVCSHYCLSSKSLNRLTDLMTRFPNLYVDTSFGSTEFALAGFQTITENNEAFRAFFESFQDRILFGTDNVVTSYEDKDGDFLTDLYQDYIWILTQDTFASDLDDESSDGQTTYKGLDLPYTIQQKVFWQNWADLVE